MRGRSNHEQTYQKEKIETAQYFPAADEVRYPYRSGRGAYLLRERGAALCRPLPEGHGALPRNDDEAGGSNKFIKYSIFW